MHVYRHASRHVYRHVCIYGCRHLHSSINPLGRWPPCRVPWSSWMLSPFLILKTSFCFLKRVRSADKCTDSANMCMSGMCAHYCPALPTSDSNAIPTHINLTVTTHSDNSTTIRKIRFVTASLCSFACSVATTVMCDVTLIVRAKEHKLSKSAVVIVMYMALATYSSV